MAKIDERVAVVETKLDTVLTRLDHQDGVNARIGDRLDLIIQGQIDGKAERATMSDKIDSMAPDIELVRTLKKFWTVVAWVSATAGAIGGAVTATKLWVVEKLW